MYELSRIFYLVHISKVKERSLQVAWKMEISQNMPEKETKWGIKLISLVRSCLHFLIIHIITNSLSVIWSCCEHNSSIGITFSNYINSHYADKFQLRASPNWALHWLHLWQHPTKPQHLPLVRATSFLHLGILLCRDWKRWMRLTLSVQWRKFRPLFLLL